MRRLTPVGRNIHDHIRIVNIIAVSAVLGINRILTQKHIASIQNILSDAILTFDDSESGSWSTTRKCDILCKLLYVKVLSSQLLQYLIVSLFIYLLIENTILTIHEVEASDTMRTSLTKMKPIAMRASTRLKTICTVMKFFTMHTLKTQFHITTDKTINNMSRVST